MVAKSLVRMGAADGEVDIGAFAVDIGRVLERFESMEEELANNAVIEEETGQVTYRTSVNTDQQVRACECFMVVAVCPLSWAT